MITNEKELFDAFSRLAELALTRRTARYQNQVRLSVVLWAGLAGAIYFDRHLPQWFVIGSFILVVGVQFAAVWRVHSLHVRDRNDLRLWLGRAESIAIGTTSPDVQIHEARERFFALLFWVGPTVLIAALAYFRIFSKSELASCFGGG